MKPTPNVNNFPKFLCEVNSFWLSPTTLEILNFELWPHVALRNPKKYLQFFRPLRLIEVASVRHSIFFTISKTLKRPKAFTFTHGSWCVAGRMVSPPLWSSCTENVMSLMSAKIGQLLVDGTDGASVIRHTTDLIKNLRHALRGMIQDSDWLGKGKQSSYLQWFG